MATFEILTSSNVIGGGGSSSYLVYTATLSQSSTDAPVPTVLENTLGGTVVWTRSSQGNYIGTLTGAFTDGKTVFAGIGDANTSQFILFGDYAGAAFGFWVGYQQTVDNVKIQTFQSDGNTVDISSITSGTIFVQIFVYP